MNEAAFVGDVEHGVDPTDAHAEANGGAQLDDLGIAEMLTQAVDEFAPDLGVRESEPLGELDRQPLAIAERRDVVVLPDGLVLFLGDQWLRTRRSACVQSNGTGVDLGDPHPREFSLTR